MFSSTVTVQIRSSEYFIEHGKFARNSLELFQKVIKELKRSRRSKRFLYLHEQHVLQSTSSNTAFVLNSSKYPSLWRGVRFNFTRVEQNDRKMAGPTL